MGRVVQDVGCDSLEPRHGGGESAWYSLLAHVLNYYIEPRADVVTKLSGREQ